MMQRNFFRLIDTIGKQLGLQIHLGADASDKQGPLEKRKKEHQGVAQRIGDLGKRMLNKTI